MKDKNLLVICNHHSTFIKAQIDVLSPNLSKINILARQNLIAKIFSLQAYLDVTDLNNIPRNVNLIVTPVFYVSFDLQYKKVGEKHFKAQEKSIKKKHIRFDLIHSHFTWSSGYVGAKLKEKYNVPCVATAHGYDIYDLPFKDHEWKEKIEYVLNAADYVITVSNSNLECIKKLSVETPVKVIPNGFRGDLFYPRDLEECRKISNLSINKKVILTVGSLVEIKGHKYLIEAMHEVLKHRKDVICIIVGGGALKYKLKNQIKNLGLENHVKLIGGKPHNEMPIWMNACDVIVLPSLRESFGIVQIEAMACGKPVVATYNGGSEEIITSEDCGYLVEPANPEELAEKILIALDKEWDGEKIRRYAERFRWENIVKEILEVYKRVS